MSASTQTFTTVITDHSWMQGLHPGHQVELDVYGVKMVGKVLKLGDDSITMRIPIEEQSGDVRRFSVTGTALISIEGAAARVPVTAQSTGEFVRMQVVGAAEIIQRRQHRRVALAAPVRLAWRSPRSPELNWAESMTVDISAGGLRVASAKTVWPSLGEVVEVSLQLPDRTVVDKARVVGKTQSYDLRLEFVALKRRNRDAIEALVEDDEDDD